MEKVLEVKNIEKNINVKKNPKKTAIIFLISEGVFLQPIRIAAEKL